METTDEILAAARALIATGGYNGFSYNDVAERVGIRKASVHHYFPSKTDLAIAVIRESREGLEHHATKLTEAATPPLDQIRGYIDFWKKCITDTNSSFCVAGMLASEVLTLPDIVAHEVRDHFGYLIGWFARLFAAARERGELTFSDEPRLFAEQFVATVYGAMLTARAMGSAKIFATVVDQAFARLRVR